MRFVFFVPLFCLLAACSCHPACSSATCAGCCDEQGICQAGIAPATCGSSGAACIACQPGGVCSNGHCSAGATGGGSVGGGTQMAGGGTGTGGGGGGGQTSVDLDGGTFETPEVKIDFQPQCPTAPCGGALAGTYFYTGACIPTSEFDPFIEQVEEGCGMGSALITAVDGGLTGFAVVQNGAILRKVTGSITVTANIGGSCVSICGLIPPSLPQDGYTGDCYVDAGVCTCIISKPIHVDDNGPFATAGNALTLAQSQKTFEYCAGSGGLVTRETDAGTTAHEPGIATLTLQH